MNSIITSTKNILLYLFILNLSFSYAQNSKKHTAQLPETIYGEWQGITGNGEYNTMLIHPEFIEETYRPFVYQTIYKNEEGIYVFDAKDKKGETRHYEIEILAADSIRLKKENMSAYLFVKHDDPLDSKRATMSDVPEIIKQQWFTTDGKNNLEFEVKDDKIVFRGKSYAIEEVVQFDPHTNEQYRFIVKNDNEYWMFYFKKWDKDYVQIGFEGASGDLYKAKKDYPNQRTYHYDDKSLVSKLPETAFGEWHGETGEGEYDALLIHPNFIENGYRPYYYQKIAKEDKDLYVFEAKDRQGNTRQFRIKIVSSDSIKLKRGDNSNALFVKNDEPLDSKRVTMGDVPHTVKKSWFTTDGKNTLVFEVSDKKIVFQGKPYTIEEVVHFDPHADEQYRFIVKNDRDYRMLYFKNWDDHFVQVGFDGKAGAIYKADKDYPDHRINNMEAYLTSDIPKALQGDWLKSDGSNRWEFSLYYDYAVLNKEIWDYKDVQKKGNTYTITLTHNNQEKTVYAKPQKNNKIAFGENSKGLETYNSQFINKPEFKITGDKPYQEEEIFKIDSATYSGIIRNYNPNKDGKTGMLHVNNVFSGNQDSHVIKIQKDGRFSVKFPTYYPQQVFVRLPRHASAVQVEPGKETWELINEGGLPLFGGDLAQLNTDLGSIEDLLRSESMRFYEEVLRHIADFSLEDYKKESYALYDRQNKILDSILKTRFISDKARQVIDLSQDYDLYSNILSYDTYSRDENSAKKMDSTYIDFLTREIYNNKLAVVSDHYDSFINRVKFLPSVRKSVSVSYPSLSKLNELLKERNISLTKEEEELMAKEEKYNEENAEAIARQEKFQVEDEAVLLSLSNKLTQIFEEIPEEKRNQLWEKGEVDPEFLINYAKLNDLGISFTEEELAVKKAGENLMTEEERARYIQYNSQKNQEERIKLYEKYEPVVQAYINSEFQRKETENIRKKLGEVFTADIIISQYYLGSLEDEYTPFSDAELAQVQKSINNSYISQVIANKNKQVQAKIEENRSKTEITVHDTPEGEADQIFDAIASKYKGKVIYVDFWATWCGPCISGIRSIAPLKEEFANEDVVFLYITDPSSPEITYNNMIPNIPGEHYRVSKDEWNYMSGRFNISGIPHHLLIDKEGEVIRRNTSELRDNSRLKNLLQKELKK